MSERREMVLVEREREREREQSGTKENGKSRNDSVWNAHAKGRPTGRLAFTTSQPDLNYIS